MSVYKDIIDELYTRLTTAQGTGKALAGLKNVYVGTRKLVDANQDLPSITILINSINEGNYAVYNRTSWVGTLEVSLLVHYGLTDERARDLYGSFLTLIETIANTIYKNTSNVFDPTFNNKLTQSFKLSGGRVEHLNDNTLGYEINLEFLTKRFAEDGR